MRFIALGTSEFVAHCIDGLLDSGQQVLLVVSLRKELRPDNSPDLTDFATKRGLHYLEVEDINAPENVGVIQAYEPDVIFTSWPKILKKPILNLPRICVIGTHPTDLPFNRGRHPLHWQIVLGFSESKLSFFRMDEGVDTGRILLQVPYEITAEDSISDLVAKVNNVGYAGALEIGRMFSEGHVPEGYEQDHHKTNYWRKRTPHDVTLDLRMSADLIIRTVRSFTLPYSCAKLIVDRYVLKVVRATLVPVNLSQEELQRIEPGKIMGITDQHISVKTADQVVELICADTLPLELRKTKYIHPPTKYLADYAEVLVPELR